MSVVDFRYKVQDMATRTTYMITKVTSMTSVTSLEGRSSVGNGIGGLASKATTNLVTCHATTLPDGDMPEKECQSETSSDVAQWTHCNQDAKKTCKYPADDFHDLRKGEVRLIRLYHHQINIRRIKGMGIKVVAELQE